MISWETLIKKIYKHERMIKDKEDDDVWAMEDDEYSLEFILDWSIRMEGFP